MPSLLTCLGMHLMSYVQASKRESERASREVSDVSVAVGVGRRVAVSVAVGSELQLQCSAVHFQQCTQCARMAKSRTANMNLVHF